MDIHLVDWFGWLFCVSVISLILQRHGEKDWRTARVVFSILFSFFYVVIFWNVDLIDYINAFFDFFMTNKYYFNFTF